MRKIDSIVDALKVWHFFTLFYIFFLCLFYFYGFTWVSIVVFVSFLPSAIFFYKYTLREFGELSVKYRNTFLNPGIVMIPTVLILFALDYFYDGII